MIQQQINKTQIEQPFDAFQFEIERFEVFQKTKASEIPSESYYAEDWDARLAVEPSEINWLDKSYRQGYLDGITNKYDEKYGLI